MVLPSILLIAVTCFLAYSNGANDNFKGVATLYGTNTVSYNTALWWTTITTFAGSVTAIFLAEMLVKSFSGKGLVPDTVAGSTVFLTSVGLGAALTVFIATIKGLPISTTHGLTGGLVGAGLMAVGDQVNFSVLGSNFFLPLFFSPLVALSMTVILFKIFGMLRNFSGIKKEMSICVANEESVLLTQNPDSAAFKSYVFVPTVPDIYVDLFEDCTLRYKGSFLGVQINTILDYAHLVSSGVVCFARGLNDTPKIVALLAIFSSFDLGFSMVAVAFGMGLGGLLNASKVANTMSKKIVPMSAGQGFSANIVTGILVVIASRFGLPVSTAHVSVGSIFGISLVNGKGNKQIIREILTSWVLTLPIAAFFSAIVYLLLTQLG